MVFRMYLGTVLMVPFRGIQTLTGISVATVLMAQKYSLPGIGLMFRYMKFVMVLYSSVLHH